MFNINYIRLCEQRLFFCANRSTILFYIANALYIVFHTRRWRAYNILLAATLTHTHKLYHMLAKINGPPKRTIKQCARSRENMKISATDHVSFPVFGISIYIYKLPDNLLNLLRVFSGRIIIIHADA